MFNKRLLKAKVVANGMTLGELSESIGISASTMTRKLKEGSFSRAEINEITDVLHLTAEDIVTIFFAPELT